MIGRRNDVRRFRRFLPALVWSLLTATGAACVSETRYAVLSFFLDGVPPPGVEEDLEIYPLQKADPEKLALENPGHVVRNIFASVHGPYVAQKCGQCHADGMERSRLRMPKAELCGTCHNPRAMFEGKVFHPPTAAGQCGGCHEPHQSHQPHLLVEAGAGICLRCHDATTFPDLENHRKTRGEDCLQCHSPHASDKPYMIR